MYNSALKLKDSGTRIISTDEKTGIQALERKSTQMKSGQVERQDHEYIRHGTQCLIANLDVATGEIISSTVGDTRTEKDFLTHIKTTIKTDPEASWVFITDQLNTHKSESLVRYIVQVLRLSEKNLGKKGKEGILKNMESRAEFLSNKEHRIRFVYTPKHASWLNQVECWFSILVKRLLKRLIVTSKEELKDKIISFIDYYNITMAKPLKWICRNKIKRTSLN